MSETDIYRRITGECYNAIEDRSQTWYHLQLMVEGIAALIDHRIARSMLGDSVVPSEDAVILNRLRRDDPGAADLLVDLALRLKQAHDNIALLKAARGL